MDSNGDCETLLEMEDEPLCDALKDTEVEVVGSSDELSDVESESDTERDADGESVTDTLVDSELVALQLRVADSLADCSAVAETVVLSEVLLVPVCAREFESVVSADVLKDTENESEALDDRETDELVDRSLDKVSEADCELDTDTEILGCAENEPDTLIESDNEEETLSVVDIDSDTVPVIVLDCDILVASLNVVDREGVRGGVFVRDMDTLNVNSSEIVIVGVDEVSTVGEMVMV